MNEQQYIYKHIDIIIDSKKIKFSMTHIGEFWLFSSICGRDVSSYLCHVNDARCLVYSNVMCQYFYIWRCGCVCVVSIAYILLNDISSYSLDAHAVLAIRLEGNLNDSTEINK